MISNNPPVSIDSSVDSHIHTRFCGHADGEMEEYVQTAIQNKLRKIIFLEHMEEGINSQEEKTWLTEEDFDNFFIEGERLRLVYAGVIEIGLGVECGFNPICAAALRTRLAGRCWDQVGISCHFLQIDNMAHHLNMFSRKEHNLRLARQYNSDNILSHYFSTLTEAVCSLPGTLLCHLDGALRWLPEISLNKTHYKQIDILLQVVKNRGMALEVNTSGIDIRREQFPNKRILTMASAYRIPLVLGSDAHKPEDTGRHFTTLCSSLFAELGR